MMDRRAFISGITGGLLAAPLGAEAQQAGKVYRIGYLLEGPPGQTSPQGRALEETLRELGYVEGRNLVVERRFAAFQYDRLPDLAAELVRLKPDVILTGGNPSIAALKQATSVPLGVAERAREVAGIAEGLKPITNPNMKSDLTTAVALAGAAITAALANVEINLESVKDAEFVAQTRKKAALLRG